MNHTISAKVAAVAVAAALALAGCGSSSSVQAVASPTPSSAAPSSQAPDPSPSAVDAAFSQCSSADYGVHIGFEAYETLMKSDDSFAAWASDTSKVQQSAQSAASFDSTFGLSANAAAASTLAAALTVVHDDLEQGVESGEAPSSYKTDVESAMAAEAPFETCTSAS